MQVRKALRKFDFRSIDRDRPKRRLAGGRVKRKVAVIHREEPAHSSPLEFHHTCPSPRVAQVYARLDHRTKHPEEQIEEVNTYVGRHTSRFVINAFPGKIVPTPTRGDVG